MFEECVSTGARELLKALGTQEEFQSLSFYLAGGTGLALQLGHRISEDLDFFTERGFEPERVIRIFAGLFSVRVREASKGTLHLICNNTKVSLFYYPYKLVFSPLRYEGCLVADCRDIAAMKLIAIAQRGSRKDFVDLFFFLRKEKMDFEQLKTVVATKYSEVQYSWPHLLKALCYFADAEKDPLPILTIEGSRRIMALQEWEKIKQYFVTLQKASFDKLRQNARENALEDCSLPQYRKGPLL